MPEKGTIKDNNVKIVIYQGHIHQIHIGDDLKDRKENLIENKVKNSE